MYVMYVYIRIPQQRQQAAEGSRPLEEDLWGVVLDDLVPEVPQAAQEAALARRARRCAEAHLEVEQSGLFRPEKQTTTKNSTSMVVS